MSDTGLRQQLIDHCLEMNASGINHGTSGNLSVRVPGGMLITPSGVPYRDLRPEDIVPVALDGSTAHRLPPSSEWRFHRDIYAARPEVGAVVHAHPTWCTVLAIHHLPIPAVHYMVALGGGPDIRCARYETYGTEELSVAALEALEGRRACLLANHGMIATGTDLARALWLAIEVEGLAQQYVLSLQLGKPHVLPDTEIHKVLAKFKDYGKRSREC